MKKLLVTGSSGLIGSEVVSYFDQSGWEVHGIDNNMRADFFGPPGDTRWSSLIWGRLHHEPFEPKARTWNFASNGPLSGANSALPWIIFERDRTQFEREFPQWQINKIELGMPFRYLISGGVSRGI